MKNFPRWKKKGLIGLAEKLAEGLATCRNPSLPSPSIQ